MVNFWVLEILIKFRKFELLICTFLHLNLFQFGIYYSFSILYYI